MEGRNLPFSVNNGNRIYNFTRLLGQGFFGKVYECYLDKTNQRYAIKVLSLRKNNPSKVEREIKFMKMIKNFEHTIQLIDSFRVENVYYIVTDLMAGGNLEQFIEKKEFLSQEQSAQFLKQIGLGLHEIHSRGIIHRDLKPENILLSSDIQNINLKVTDFGLSNQQDLAVSNVGNLLYTAPEQHENGQDQTYAVDIWGLGTIFYEMVTGKIVLSEQTRQELSKF